MSKIRLEPINDDNFYAVTKLKLAKEQKHFVATNSYSLIHAYLATLNGQKAYPFAILLGDKPVGFIMIGFDILSEKVKDNPKCNWFICDNYILWRLMIDKKYQGKGYAKEMLKSALPFCHEINLGKVLITCNENNVGSEKTIVANGGVYESTVYEPNEQVNLKRYWINI